MTGILERTAGAPISWGICEVPGWGLQMSPERVLGEMAALGLRATELGADGFLPADPAALRELLRRHGLRLVGGFVPLVLHEPAAADETLGIARRVAGLLSAAGAERFVTAAVTDYGWGPRTPLDDGAWAHLTQMLARVDEVVSAAGMTQALHPHAGTVVQNADEIWRVLAASDVLWCLDTGHLAIGGLDPAEFAEAAADRVVHVHLKDVRLDVSARVAKGELTLLEGTRAGIFRPLGQGDLGVDRIIGLLETSGYDGWYVLEQDVALDREVAEGKGPFSDVRASLEYLRSVASPGGDVQMSPAQ